MQEIGLSLITMVERQKKNKHRYNIFLNEQYAFSVHEDIMIKHRLLKGEHVHADQIAQILKDDEQNAAYMKAIRYLGTRPRTVKEVTTKLRKEGYEDELIAHTVQKLMEQNYINDQQFAKRWTEL
jgi:regulatory protein